MIKLAGFFSFKKLFVVPFFVVFISQNVISSSELTKDFRESIGEQVFMASCLSSIAQSAEEYLKHNESVTSKTLSPIFRGFSKVLSLEATSRYLARKNEDFGGYVNSLLVSGALYSLPGVLLKSLTNGLDKSSIIKKSEIELESFISMLALFIRQRMNKGEESLIPSANWFFTSILSYITPKISNNNSTASVLSLLVNRNDICENGIFDTFETISKIKSMSTIYAILSMFAFGAVIKNIKSAYQISIDSFSAVKDAMFSAYGYVRNFLGVSRGQAAQNNNPQDNQNTQQQGAAPVAAQKKKEDCYSKAASYIQTFAFSEILKILLIGKGVKLYDDVPNSDFLRFIAMPSSKKCLWFSSIALLPCAWTMIFKNNSKILDNAVDVFASLVIGFNDLPSVVGRIVGNIRDGFTAKEYLLESSCNLADKIISVTTNGRYSLTSIFKSYL